MSLRKIIIQLLFRLLEVPSYEGMNDKNIAQWLAAQHQDPRFRDYYRKRDLAILRTMGIGLSPKEYDRMLGHRLELNMMLNDMDKAYKAEGKRKAKLLKEKK